MAPRGLEQQIDGLYQLPLEEFTSARNSLAKAAGGESARVRGLVKPPIGAWAVNQLYWLDRAAWDALIAAAENARRVHRGVLAGRAGDVRAANKVHDEAVEKALKATLALLTRAGHPAADVTRHAIGVTLRALPGDEPPGRLTHMLQPAGFETLAGLSLAAAAGRSPKPAPAPPAPAPARKSVSRADAKALTLLRQAAASAARVLRDAENAARREEFERARTEREAKRCEDAVETAGAAARAAAAALKEAEAAATRAARLRDASAERAADAARAVAKAKKEADAAAAALARAENGH